MDQSVEGEGLVAFLLGHGGSWCPLTKPPKATAPVGTSHSPSLSPGSVTAWENNQVGILPSFTIDSQSQWAVCFCQDPDGHVCCWNT